MVIAVALAVALVFVAPETVLGWSMVKGKQAAFTFLLCVLLAAAILPVRGAAPLPASPMLSSRDILERDSVLRC